MPGLAAYRALRVFADTYAGPLHAQGIEQQQTSAQRLTYTHDELQGFGCLAAAYDAYQRGKHTHRGAQYFFEWLFRREQAGITGGFCMAAIKDR